MPETKPRYTVELTTEGWQIGECQPDTSRPRPFVADVYASREEAQKAADAYNVEELGQ